ncbi:hypothetical protein BX070DRAFT_249810 [Coemansia spiralis]|nr:hypothetical protein BX070DRAFT_249810 [Coemansia spiralis]
MSLYRILPTLVSRNAGGRALRAPRSLKPLCQCKLAKRSFTTCGAIRKDKDPKDEVDNEWNRSIEEAIERAKREDENDFMTNLGQVMIQLPKQLEGFFELGSAAASTQSRSSSSSARTRGCSCRVKASISAWPSQPAAGGRFIAKSNADEANDSKSYDVFVRWVFEGIPRHTEIIGGHGSRYEGEFRYHIDRKSGLVALHEVTAIHPAPPTKFLATTGWRGGLDGRRPRGRCHWPKPSHRM